MLDATVAVADAVFDLLAEDWREVPFVCQEHGAAASPRAVDNRAIWWCTSGHHVVAEIGQLTPSAG